MRFNKTFLILLMVALMALWGCSDDDDDGGTDPPVPTDFELLAQALDDYIGVRGAYIAANALQGDLDNWEVIDVRREEDYNAGHIEGAILSSIPDIVTNVQAQGWPMDQQIAVTCYTGQSARFAQMFLTAAGYTEVYSLLFGMSAWNTSLVDRYWRNPSRTDFELPANLIETTVNDETAESYEYPTPLADNVADAAAALTAIYTAEGFGHFAVSTDQLAADVESGNVDWYIANYHPLYVYDGPDGEPGDNAGVPGHIQGAYCYPPGESFSWGQKLEHLPTDQPIAVYCWTGQTSGFMAAYLRMLGYEAYTVTQGCNDMFYDLLTAHKWTDPGYDYPLIVEE
jgi:rhodanese-related sulfurtransferase